MGKQDHVPRHRLSVEISEEQRRKLDGLFPHGLQRPFFSVIVDEIITLLELGGEQALAVVIGKAVKPREVLPTLKEMERKTTDGNS